MKALLAAAAMILMAGTTAMAGSGHSDDTRVYGEPGIPDHPMRTMRLQMLETDTGMVFNPKTIMVRKGEQIRFEISNKGGVDHEFVIGTVEENLEHGAEMAKFPEMEHDDPNMVKLVSGDKGEVLWMFTEKGTFDFSCLLPGHRESGMFGTIIVN